MRKGRCSRVDFAVSRYTLCGVVMTRRSWSESAEREPRASMPSLSTAARRAVRSTTTSPVVESSCFAKRWRSPRNPLRAGSNEPARTGHWPRSTRCSSTTARASSTPTSVAAARSSPSQSSPPSKAPTYGTPRSPRLSAGGQRSPTHSRQRGLEPRRADELAVLIIAGFEGALILSRAYRDLAPLQTAHRELRGLLQAELPSPEA